MFQVGDALYFMNFRGRFDAKYCDESTVARNLKKKSGKRILETSAAEPAWMTVFHGNGRIARVLRGAAIKRHRGMRAIKGVRVRL